MFNKFFFEEVARKRLTENAFLRWQIQRNDRFYRKKGWVKKMPNGGEAIDIIKVHAHNEKINALMLLVCLGAPFLGTIASEITDRK